MSISPPKNWPQPSQKTILFGFGIGDEVSIAAIAMPGRVAALMLDCEGLMYRVVYWNDGSRKSEWMHAWELNPAGKGN